MQHAQQRQSNAKQLTRLTNGQEITGGSMTILERIESVVGTLQRYDGRYCIWTTTGTHDIRDILYKMRGVSLADAMETLCEATEAESKRIKAERIAARERETI